MSLGIVPQESATHQGTESACHQRMGAPDNQWDVNYIFIDDTTGGSLGAPGPYPQSGRLSEILGIPWSFLGREHFDYFRIYNHDFLPEQNFFFDSNDIYFAYGGPWVTGYTVQAINGQPIFKNVSNGLQVASTCGYRIQSREGNINHGETNYVTTTGWMNARYRERFQSVVTGFYIRGYIWARDRDDNHGWIDLDTSSFRRSTMEGVEFMGNFSGVMNQWFNMPLSLINTQGDTPPGLYQDGVFARVIYRIIDETKAEWSARTGIAL